MGYRVAVLMGSPNDGDKMAPVAATLERYGVEADVRVMSAHRSPALVSEFVSGARDVTGTIASEPSKTPAPTAAESRSE